VIFVISISDLIFLVAFENEILKKKFFGILEDGYRGQKNKSGHTSSRPFEEFSKFLKMDEVIKQ
jgi:hypothetical protein